MRWAFRMWELHSSGAGIFVPYGQLYKGACYGALTSAMGIGEKENGIDIQPHGRHHFQTTNASNSKSGARSASFQASLMKSDF